MFQTLEIPLDQARELSTWYTEMVEKRGTGWGPLMEAAGEIYDRAVALGLMLGLLKENEDGATCVSDHGSAVG